MGRPKGFNGKCEQYRLRLSQEENYILKKLAEKEGLSKAEVLRKGVKIFNYLSKNGGIIGYPEIEENDYWISKNSVKIVKKHHFRAILD